MTLYTRLVHPSFARHSNLSDHYKFEIYTTISCPLGLAKESFILEVGHWFVCTQILEISASADGGPRSRVCARETLRSAPHRH